MRKSINGLMAIVQKSFDLDPFGKAFFVFCHWQRNRLKILTWEENGFWLHFKRLERRHFTWPASGEGEFLKLMRHQYDEVMDIAADRGKKIMAWN